MGRAPKTVVVHESFEASEQADIEYYRSLTPTERVDLLLELVARHRESLGEAGKRFVRVCRVVDGERS